MSRGDRDERSTKRRHEAEKKRGVLPLTPFAVVPEREFGCSRLSLCGSIVEGLVGLGQNMILILEKGVLNRSILSNGRRNERAGIVEGMTTVITQISGCEEAFRKVSGIGVLVDLMDDATGTSLRTKENAMSTLLNVVRCRGERVERDVRERLGVRGAMEGVADVAENGSVKWKSKVAALLKVMVIDDGDSRRKKRASVGSISSSQESMKLSPMEAIALREAVNIKLVGVGFSVNEIQTDRHVSNVFVGTTSGKAYNLGAETLSDIRDPSEEDVIDDAERKMTFLFCDCGN
ncbi:U-box domain-containing protein 11 [Senna tora]|uniref:U-box domain-containing protein 11 n=1 Tax=Senna tora TaxID=362788 RepID=A0A834T2A1_9FABA|nr:U-box domain-containing protein 11 [Senna tora]